MARRSWFRFRSRSTVSVAQPTKAARSNTTIPVRIRMIHPPVATFPRSMRLLQWMRRLAAIFLLALVAASPAPDPARNPVARESLQNRCDALLAKWKDRLNEEHFASVVSPPFVIAGDASPEKLRAYRDQTVLAASKALHATYFDAEPTEPILILLFETEPPYKRLAKKWFDDDDVPHFGFCRSDGVMLMNIS